MTGAKLSRRKFLSASAGMATALAARAEPGASANLQGLDKVIADAVTRQDVPFAVAMVADRNRVLYQGVAGNATATHPATIDTAFRIFSMTKGIGTLAAMMMVDRKRISLDAPVASELPEFGKLQVIESIGPSGPVMRPPKRPVTLRHLLTHTSGLTYSVWNLKEFAWEKATGTLGQWTGRKSDFLHPLAFDPGDAWAYGIGIDWAGFLIAQVDGRTIDRFVTEEILQPLGMLDTLFEPAALNGRLADARQRNAQGEFAIVENYAPVHADDSVYGMGQALYSTAPDYIKFLQFILNGTGKQGSHRLIRADTLRQMTMNQIGQKSISAMKTLMPDVSSDVDFFPGSRKTWTFGFLRNEVDIPGMRRAGSLAWAGLQNTHYWIDPSRGITAVLMTQTLPFVEPRFMNVYTQFERHVYQAMT